MLWTITYRRLRSGSVESFTTQAYDRADAVAMFYLARGIVRVDGIAIGYEPVEFLTCARN